MSSVISHWTPSNQDHAKALLAQYPDPRSAVMPLLYVASLQYRFVTDQAMADVAALTGITPAQVQSVASFYTMFKREPVGRYLISVCTSISCHLLGGDEVLDAVEGAAGVSGGATDADGVIAVERAECIGACGGAPAVQVNYETVEGLTPEKATELVSWLRDTTPPVVLADEMQHLFGGRRSFPWGPTEADGPVGAIPAFGPYGSAGEGR
jgi:NADH:ubiquinone oxidoreductase subunit E